ncbi:MAG TPA: hypothetical protein PKB13_13695 [Clostridia bacterium]|nr:hypothetical protein [Clostridia bacterium]
MITIQVNIEEDILKEAESALYSIGMDVQIAISIFLRRVALEKGFPLPMSTPSTSQREAIAFDEIPPQRIGTQPHLAQNNTITRAMVDAVWTAFMVYYKGNGKISSLSYEVSETSGMSQGSAFIYLNILLNLVKGEPNTRNMKIADLKYLLGKINTELGTGAYQNAINSLKQSIPYWRARISESFADQVEALCE